MEFNATFLISAISFLVFTYLMNVILYKPIENIVNEREKLINDNYIEANKTKEKSESLLKEIADKLALSKIEAKKLINAKKFDTENKVAKILSDAKSENSQFLNNRKLEMQKEAEIIDANTDVISTAQLISDKLLNEHIIING